MFNKCSQDVHITCKKAPTKVSVVLINYFWEQAPTSYWSLNTKTYLEQIACQEDECSSGGTVVISGRFPCSFLVRTVAANYRKSAMRFLMLPLPLILCFINCNTLQTYAVLVVSAPSIHGNSQWVPTLGDAHPHIAAFKASLQR